MTIPRSSTLWAFAMLAADRVSSPAAMSLSMRRITPLLLTRYRTEDWPGGTCPGCSTRV